MSYGAVCETAPITGVPGVAIRVGRALENWGRSTARPIDRDALRREVERQRATTNLDFDEAHRRQRW